jgi:hypothetical protein
MQTLPVSVSRKIWIPAVIALLLISIGLAAPLAIKRYVEGWLRDRGVAEARITDVDLNPFTGRVRVEYLDAPGAADESGSFEMLELDLELLGLVTGRVMVSRAILRDAVLDVRRMPDGRFSVGGLMFPLAQAEQEVESDGEGPAGSPRPRLGLAGLLVENVTLTYDDGMLSDRLYIRSLTIDRMVTWEPERAARLVAELELNGAPVGLEAEVFAFADERRATISIDVDAFDVAAFAPLVADLGIESPGGSLSLSLGGQLRREASGRLFGNVAGTVGVDDIAFGLHPLQIDLGKLSLDVDLAGEIEIQSGDSPPAISGQIGVAASDLLVDHRDWPARLLGLETMEAPSVRVDGLERASSDTLSVRGLRLLEEEEVVGLSVGSASVEGIELDTRARALRIGEVSLDDLVARLRRGEQGRLRLLGPAAAEEPSAQPEAAPGADDGAPSFELHVGAVSIGGNSALGLEDLSVEPQVTMELVIDRFRLADLGIGPAAGPMVLDVALTQNGAQLSATGDLALFADARQVKADLEVVHFDLSQLTPYLPNYRVDRGRLSIQTQLGINGDEVAAENAVLLEKLKVGVKRSGDPGLVEEGLGMPLDVALDLLRDGDDRIKFDLPISGSIHDPKFGTGDIVRLAMQNALQRAALSVATNALQPLGTIMFVGKMAGKAARPRFDPVAFEPGARSLSELGTSYLDKLAGLLLERPRLHLTFCGVAAVQDVAAAEAVEGDGSASADGAPAVVDEAALLELARARGSAVHDYLIDVRGIPAARLFRCHPEYEAESEEGPRVEIML